MILSNILLQHSDVVVELFRASYDRLLIKHKLHNLLAWIKRKSLHSGAISAKPAQNYGSSEEFVGGLVDITTSWTSAQARQRGSAPRASALASPLNGRAKG